MAGNNQVPYYGTIPTIAQAYQNDPRSKLAQSALALGTSTAPVAQGGWAVPDGLARAAQAILGAVVNKNQEKKYGKREQDYTSAMAQAAQMASTPQPGAAPNPAAMNPATVNPAMAAAANALGGGQPPAPQPGQIHTIDPNTAYGPQGGPQQANFAPPGPQPPAMGAMGSGGAPSPAVAGPSMAPQPPAPAVFSATRGLPSVADLYRTGIRPIEGGTDPKTGAFRTSPKGAVGPGQIMPGTGPEAARLAGLPWDEKRFRSDTQYNDALGQAYYAKQLQDFGDPLKAAAAYNAGPGRVRTALRRARRTGTDYTAHLPAETQEYVQKFAAAIGGGQQGGADPTYSAGASIVQPQMEARPQLPEMPGAAPGAPQLPPEVQTNRIGMAQALMQSGNPDLMQIAQTYLEKGLDEQGDNRRLASQQQFQQGQTGYTANLNDWQGARNDARGAVYNEYRDAGNRNFQREQTYTGQVFQAGQSELDRRFNRETREDNQQYGTAERQATQAFQREQEAIQRGWQTGENKAQRETQLEIAGIRADAKGRQQQQRNAYFNSPTGLKMQKEAGDAITANNTAIDKYKRFMDLNERQGTGGVALNTPGIASVYGWADSDLREMNSLANDATLANLGGGLGAQISDSDRKFIMDSNISTSSPRTANVNIARARIGALRRKNDYLVEFANAQADGTAPQFAKEWSIFASQTPIVQYGKDGNAIATDKPLTFSQWKASRPKYDVSGKRVN